MTTYFHKPGLFSTILLGVEAREHPSGLCKWIMILPSFEATQRRSLGVLGQHQPLQTVAVQRGVIENILCIILAGHSRVATSINLPQKEKKNYWDYSPLVSYFSKFYFNRE